jgi:glycosyltransferase involved in cell wall biosynthesis
MYNSFSVIMPVTCQQYEGAATSRSEKFINAVNSFLAGLYPSSYCELIIISDGDKIAENIYNDKFKNAPNIKFKKIEKQVPNFSGSVRQAGIELAVNDFICYLDSDDEFGIEHLLKINAQLNIYKSYDWFYFDELVNGNVLKKVKVQHGSIGTSSLVHKRSLDVSWAGCDGYGHDFVFVQRLVAASKNYVKIDRPQYFIMHIPNILP